MTPRVEHFTKCMLVLAVHCGWVLAGRTAAVHTQPPSPSTIEAQAKFFQYVHAPTPEDYDQGHRQGSAQHFTERHERSQPSHGLFSAKVRWGDKHGGYGEHYWDLNHHGSNDDNDDGSYDENVHTDDASKNHMVDSLHAPSDQNLKYGPEIQPTIYEDRTSQTSDGLNDRAKRAQPRIKYRSQINNQKTTPEVEPKVRESANLREFVAHDYTDDENIGNVVTAKLPSRQWSNQERSAGSEDTLKVVPRNQYYAPSKQSQVQYESGAGVRQNYRSSPTTSRLFLEPSTGHIVDRVTGQAFMLQPIAAPVYK